VRAREEAAGLDLSQHGEAAYETVAGRAQVTSHRAAATAPAPGTR
jgi:hypothetical protein